MKAFLPFIFCALGSILTGLNAGKLSFATHAVLFALGVMITFLSLVSLGTRSIRKKWKPESE